MLEQVLGENYANSPDRLAAVRILATSVNNSKGRETRLLEESMLINLEQGLKEVEEKSPYVLVFDKASYSLPYGETNIGRAKNNQIVIDNPYVSRNHCVIVVHTDNRVEIFESSSNGTLVNDEEIVHAVLQVGDKIVIAPKNCNFKITLSEDKEVSATLVNQELNSYIPTNNQRNSNANNIAGFSLIELLLVIIILGIISAISIANITSSRRAANSASAIQSLRLITSSEASYSTGAGNGEYATANELVREQYIDESLAAATLPTPLNIRQQPKSGYVFVFDTTANNPTTNTLADYQISARPLLGNGVARAGDKSFFVDSSGVIRFSPSALPPFADANSQPLQ
jgi:prepilin-type N-terminal cleavage/methylation domain-containing protein